MTAEKWLQGNVPVEERLCLSQELDMFRQNPLVPLIRKLDRAERTPLIHDELDRCSEAYYFYYLCLERYLSEMWVAIQWEKGPRWVRGRGQKYGSRQRRIADNYHQQKRFLLLDFFNCLLHARILCDRTISLSRYFLDEKVVPSFGSFHDHKKFFQQFRKPYGRHEEYAAYFRERTEWFDMPLKPVRDKYLVHSGPKHMRILGYARESENDLQLTIVIPDGPDVRRPLERVKVVEVSLRRLAREIREFLEWFSSYGLRVLDK